MATITPPLLLDGGEGHVKKMEEAVGAMCGQFAYFF
jgi:hypothetical protein